jgi:hypothetical protein
MSAGRRDTVLWFLATTALCLVFVVIAARNLENFRPVSGDDAWIMSGSYKLATRGVLGSDLYAGLFRGEDHYFFNLPVLHYFQAASFQVSAPAWLRLDCRRSWQPRHSSGPSAGSPSGGTAFSPPRSL